MGRGEEEGGFFDCYQSRLSLSRNISPQQKKRTQHKRNLQFFLLSSHIQSSFCFYIRPTFLVGVSRRGARQSLRARRGVKALRCPLARRPRRFVRRTGGNGRGANAAVFFLLSSHFQSSFCFYIRPTFLSPLRCIALFMYFSSSVFSSLFIALFDFSIFSFFWSFPSVEGPHSDTLSRTRFSVFLRILFGVSSSSSSNFLLFWSFPEVEGPHSDTFSRTRFSVFLRILFGVSSSSSSSKSSRVEQQQNWASVNSKR